MPKQSVSQDALLELSDASFEQQVLRTSGVSLVFFWSSWSSECEAQRTALQELLARQPIAPGAQVVQLNVEESPMMAIQYDLLTLPALLLIDRGRVVESHQGYTPLHNLEPLLQRACVRAERLSQSSSGASASSAGVSSTGA